MISVLRRRTYFLYMAANFTNTTLGDGLSAVDEYKKILNEMSSEHNVDISAIVSRNGVPIAWNIPEEMNVETFATLSATIIGASEVIYTGLKRESPQRVVVHSENGSLVAVGISKKALLVAIGSEADDKVFEAVDEAKKKIEELLESQAEI
jgi:predicted regulator of Ras-like GTPase activity (Roadblock/LC7/MglB family)